MAMHGMDDHTLFLNNLDFCPFLCNIGMASGTCACAGNRIEDGA